MEIMRHFSREKRLFKCFKEEDGMDIITFLRNMRKEFDESNIDIFDYRKVLKPRLSPELRPPYMSNTYGNGYVLKRYSGYKGRANAVIEHGIRNINDTFNTHEYRDNPCKGLIVSSQKRADFLKGLTSKKILAIGPTIFYANNIYDDFEMEIIKHNLGKTLLLFPAHSDSNNCKTMYDDREFIKYAKEVREKWKFDTVLACIYALDFRTGQHLLYESENIPVVTAGNPYNKDFLDILKTIISISDGVLNCGFSTNVGYSIYLNKPVQIIEQSTVKNTSNFFEGLKEDIELYKHQSGILLNKAAGLFQEYTDVISNDQYQWSSDVFGYNDTKSPVELKDYFKSLR